ncbi:protein LTO1 homolog [Actinia tenebrosa]|uniref:Protein LTO1 homolog n=1 Tax=Actinia tenebrosa TaxID=6105 RepID=A0A6P8HJ55_ACTTE|nr:protein LTO1 homolog [Actinia tenebrosa]
MADAEDPFESLLFLEENCHKDGYNEGWIVGQGKGLSVGRGLGIDKGKEIGSEIGYYSGFVSTWLLLIDKSDKKGARVNTQLQNLNSLIDQLSITDPTDENLFANIEKVRAKFKKIISLLGVSPEGRTQETEMLSF